MERQWKPRCLHYPRQGKLRATSKGNKAIEHYDYRQLSINYAVFILSPSFQRISTGTVVHNNRSAQTALIKCPSIDCVGKRNVNKYALQKLDLLFLSMAACKVSTVLI